MFLILLNHFGKRRRLSEGQLVVVNLVHHAGARTIIHGLGRERDVVGPIGSCAILRTREELYFIRDNLGDIALGSVLRIIGTGLDAADDRNFTALGKIAAAKFSLLTPRYDVDEIRLANALLIDKAAIDGERKGAYRYAATSSTEYKITFISILVLKCKVNKMVSCCNS